jgi:hypothetical protein
MRLIISIGSLRVLGACKAMATEGETANIEFFGIRNKMQDSLNLVSLSWLRLLETRARWAWGQLW